MELFKKCESRDHCRASKHYDRDSIEMANGRIKLIRIQMPTQITPYAMLTLAGEKYWHKMVKDNKQKRIDKITEEKQRLAKRATMLAEIKLHSIDNKTQNKLKSIVTSNQKAKKVKNTPKQVSSH